MHETYRMLGNEHAAELEREAVKHRLAFDARSSRHADAGPETVGRGEVPRRHARSRFALYLLRLARVED